jgi:predicted dehydrogenase
MPPSLGYVGIDHHHRDPYFAIASRLGFSFDAVCEPGRTVDVESLTAMDNRPDEITTEREQVDDLVENATVFEDPHRLLREASIDVLWVTYKNSALPNLIETAAEEDIHVISEKPIARTASDLVEVAETTREAGIRVVPTTFYRANPIVSKLRELVDSGYFGDVWTVEGRFNASQLEYRNTDHYLYDSETSRGGALQWIGPHWVDMIPYILDDPITAVNAKLHPAKACDIESGAVLQFETETGTVGTFHTGYYLDERGKDTHLGIYGTDAQARTPVHHDSLQHEPTVPLNLTASQPDSTGTASRTYEYEFSYDTFPEWGDYVYDYFEAVFDGIEDGTVPADIDDVLHVLRILDAAYESEVADEWVDLEGVETPSTISMR